MKNYYEILEVNEHASKEIIEKAYKVLAKKNHPDLYVGELRRNAELRLRDINEAYKILSDDFLREQYDNEIQKDKIEEYIKERTENKDTRKNTNNKRRNNKDIKKQKKENENNIRVTGMAANIELVKMLLKHKPKKINLKDLKRDDWVAIALTIVILIILGIILWFIPFTNGWIRELTVDNPLFSWIGKIFSK